MAARKPKPKTTAATIKAGADTYTLAMGTVALIALERVREIGFMRLPEMFEDTRLEALRDLLAAALIEFHPQLPKLETSNIVTPSLIEALSKITGSARIASMGPTYDWEAQQRFAEGVLDRTGAFAVMKAVGEAFYSSPHLKGDGSETPADED